MIDFSNFEYTLTHANALAVKRPAGVENERYGNIRLPPLLCGVEDG